jgi:CRP-like cAMP-binding protein
MKRVRHFITQRENGLLEPGVLKESHAGQNICDHLLTMDIFRGLGLQDFAVISHAIEKRTSCQGQLIYSQEDPVEALFLLKHGRVRLYRLTPSGKRLELAVIEPGTFFGEMPLLGNRCATPMPKRSKTRCFAS